LVSLFLRMISAQTLRVCREGKPVPTFPDHARMAMISPKHYPSADILESNCRRNTVRRWHNRYPPNGDYNQANTRKLRGVPSENSDDVARISRHEESRPGLGREPA
jgi:hypothetical protein